jgi:hypothetical protein
MKELEFSDKQNEFLARCKQIGFVLDICFFNFNNAESDYFVSQNAAVEGMKVFVKRYLERLIALNPNRDVSEYFQLNISEDTLPSGQTIDYKEFIGGFDFKANLVKLFSYSESSRSVMHYKGLTRALLNPPYGINLGMRGQELSVEYGVEETKRMTAFLFEFLEQIIGVKQFSDFEKLTIYSWSNDWSNYFNAGKEWWGTFFWTILNQENNSIIVIGASQTD